MRIQNINSTNPQKNNIGFKNWERVVYNQKPKDITNKVLHRNTTWFLRPSVKYWQDLVLFLTQHFIDAPKVNTYIYGCSDGSDAYSFFLVLQSILKQKMYQKFLPIIAKDYDPKAIEKCLSRKIALNESETNNIKELINLHNHDTSQNKNNFDEFFEFFSYNDGDINIIRYDNGYEYWTNDFIYKIKKPLFRNIIFQQADITQDYINIEPNNSIIFARNFWPYIEENKRMELANNLYGRLGNNSVLILGNFDNLCDDSGEKGSDALVKAGFKTSPINYCFIKND